MLVLDVYFDYSCPWSYLAFVRAREAAMRTAAEIRWRPVLADRIFEAMKSQRLESRLAVDPRKAELVAELDHCPRLIRANLPTSKKTSETGPVFAAFQSPCRTVGLSIQPMRLPAPLPHSNRT